MGQGVAHIKKTITQGMGVGNRFKAQIIERRDGHPDYGKVVFETPWEHNLILDTGMDGAPSRTWASMFTYCAIGTDSTPVQDDSGSVTATTSGTTVTASAPFFGASDVGKLLRFSTGEKSKITAYTDNQHVTVADTLGVSSATAFSLYRIAQTALFAEQKRSNTYLTGTGNCGYSLDTSTGIATLQRTYDFSAETGGVSYYEVGFSHLATGGTNVNMRGIFAGAPITLVAGQQLRVIYYFLETLTPITPRTQEVPITGWPSKEYSVTADSTTDLITLHAHGFPDQMPFSLDGVTPPGGLSFGTRYYVKANNADTFFVSATAGGSAINITSNGSGVVLLTNTIGQEQLSSWSIDIVDASTGSSQPLPSAVETNEPSTSKSVAISDDTAALPTFGSSYPTGTPVASVSLTGSSYVNGSYTKSWTGTFSTVSGNSSNLRKFWLFPTGGSSSTMSGLIYLFNEPQEKTSLYTLTLTFKQTWDRIFV